jgi:phage terminase small subunit
MTTKERLVSNLETIKMDKDSAFYKLTLKQQGFVSSYIKTSNATQAVCENYNVKNRESAKVMAHTLRRNSKIRQVLVEIHEDAGVTIEQAAEIIKRGLSAMKTFNHDGRVIESKCPDHQIRLEYVKLYYESMGVL